MVEKKKKKKKKITKFFALQANAIKLIPKRWSSNVHF